MSDNTGKFVWYELMTDDPAAAEKFYGDVVGWSTKDAGMPDRPYTLLSANGTQVAGLMKMPDAPREGGASPFWIGYIWVEDVDDMAAKVEKAGGSLHRPAADIPGVGRFAIVADPHGAVFCLFHGMSREGDAPSGDNQMKPGHTGWHELMAGDLDEAFKFYSGLFGWQKADAIDMGAMGVYQLFARDGVTLGGMMTAPPQSPRPHWGYYFTVKAIEPAAERVKKGGGQVINGPMEVPGGAWIIQCMDPQNAMFALVAPPA
jgi:uncharacterized protein